jgi:tRNA-2-methylthio-N6-dimethylallyladenosine synthase
MKFFIKTYGCQMNVLDSDKIGGILSSLGYEPAAGAREADLILLNTCSVREGAASKVFAELGRLRPLKRRGDVILGVVGCVAQQEGEAIFQRAPYVDLVMGPRAIQHLPELLQQARDSRALDTTFYEDSVLFPDRLIARTHTAKAFITVMEGCDKQCAFCIVPTTRGREVCRPLADILVEARRALDQGYIEVELLGQNVNCWKEGKSGFVDLLDAVSLLPGLKRLRFTTSHPRHFPLAAADLMAARPVLCPYLHLPVQAGSDRILKLMRRQYDRGWYLDLISAVRERVPHVALSTDIIVGFPAESEADFEDTLDVVRRVEYDQIFSFRYSPRPGTPAASMGEAVPEETARMRHQRLLQEQAPIQARRYRAFAGRVMELLVEGPSAREGTWAGRTPCNKVVNFGAPLPPKPGTLVTVRVTRSSQNSLQGELVT